jgi:DNA-binding transcriptional LysR family regulator
MNLRGVDLNLLTVLHAVLEEGHVSRAATRLGMSQPATSSALDRCRHLFGDALLERVGNRMQLTVKAQALRQPLGEVMGDITALLGIEPPPLGELRQAVHIVMADALGLNLGRGLREAVAETAPGINLVLHPWGGGSAAVEQLARGSVDLAVSVLPHLSPASFHAEVVSHERYVVAMRRDHPAARGFDLEQWLGWPHLIVSAQGATRTPVDDALAAIGRTRQVDMVVPSFVLVAELLRGSNLIALVPERALPSAADAAIAAFEPPVPIEGFDVHLAWHRRREQDRGVRHVADAVRRLMGAGG